MTGVARGGPQPRPLVRPGPPAAGWVGQPIQRPAGRNPGPRRTATAPAAGGWAARRRRGRSGGRLTQLRLYYQGEGSPSAFFSGPRFFFFRLIIEHAFEFGGRGGGREVRRAPRLAALGDVRRACVPCAGGSLRAEAASRGRRPHRDRSCPGKGRSCRRPPGALDKPARSC